MPFVILDFPTDEATCRERTRGRAKERADASEATEAVLDHQLRMHEAPQEDERAFVVPFAGPGDGGQPAAIEQALAQIEDRRRQFAPRGPLIRTTGLVALSVLT